MSTTAAATEQAERVRAKVLADVEALIRKRRDKTTFTSDAKLLNLVLQDVREYSEETS